jgi:hypothetical protein
MAAKIDFGNRGEPAQLKAAFRFYEESRFGKIVLGSNCLQQAVIEPRIQRANCGRISFENSGCERIDLVLPDLHDFQ